jgi:hypothetical protein
LPKSRKEQRREPEGDSDDDKQHQQHPQRRRLPIVNSHLLGRVLATAETQLSGPPGFFFAAMPTECTPQRLAGKKKLEAASARKTRAKLAAETAASGEIRPDGSIRAAKTAEEGSQIQPEPGPSGGCGGQTEVKIEAQTKVTRDAAPDHLLSDNPGSEDNSGVAESQRLVTSPKKKGKFDQKLPEGDTGERHVPPEVQASVDDMGDVGRGNDGEGNNLASLSFGSDTEYLSETHVVINSEVKINGSLAMGSLLRL